MTVFLASHQLTLTCSHRRHWFQRHTRIRKNHSQHTGCPDVQETTWSVRQTRVRGIRTNMVYADVQQSIRAFDAVGVFSKSDGRRGFLVLAHLRFSLSSSLRVRQRVLSYSFIHSFIHAFIHAFIHSSIDSFIHSSIHSFIHILIHSFISSHSLFFTMLLPLTALHNVVTTHCSPQCCNHSQLFSML